jgi:hypothetical protein
MKYCYLCKQQRELKNFHKDNRRKDGLQTSCKDCKKKLAKVYYMNNRDKHIESRKKYYNSEKGKITALRNYNKMRLKFPEKTRARRILNKEIDKGNLFKRNSCEICHNSPTHGHHEDYNKPLEIIWLCQRCHYLLHKHYKIKIKIN